MKIGAGYAAYRKQLEDDLALYNNRLIQAQVKMVKAKDKNAFYDAQSEAWMAESASDDLDRQLAKLEIALNTAERLDNEG